MSEAINCPSNWPYFADGGVILDHEDGTAASSLFWEDEHRVERGPACSVEVLGAKAAAAEEGQETEVTDSSGKRKREDAASKDCVSLCNKATREKQRRGRLNDRFLALSQVLEPGRPPKTDKASILSDAVRVLGQLRAEAQQLQDGNRVLRDQIRELKGEKNELRDEKSRLKAEKERIESQVKAVALPPGLPGGYMPHPAAMQAAAAAAVAAQAQAQLKPVAPVPQFPPSVAMWQWMPPANVDTSQDHMLRPPVA